MEDRTSLGRSTVVGGAAATRHRESGTQAVGRAIDLMKQVAAANVAGLRLVDLARSLQISPPTAHRLSAALVSEGLLRKDPTTGRFHLGDFAIAWGLLSDPITRLKDVCRPHLRRLAEATGDTAFLVVRSGSDAVCLDRVEGSFPIRAVTLDVGSCRPLGVGAGGLAILASMEADERSKVYADRREALAEFQMLPAGELERRARQARKLGHAVSAGVVVTGVTGVGVAVRLPGATLAAVSVAAISQRIQPQQVKHIATLLHEEAAAIEDFFKRTQKIA